MSWQWKLVFQDEKKLATTFWVHIIILTLIDPTLSQKTTIFFIQQFIFLTLVAKRNLIDPYSYKKKPPKPVTFITLNKQRDSRMCFNTKDKSSLKRDCSVSTSLLSDTHKSHAPVNMTPGHLKYGLKDLTSIPVYAVSYKESDRNGLYLNFSPVGTRSRFTCITRSTRAMWFT